ncbi:ABC1 kinase family protein [Corynebacterium uterequi]|uniref:Putative unusual protein kinase n=1 Tax=Corynebacterium uterequi TaxID=1072256 RepID=A0A0G3HCF4_9CORY|nr:AarF/UbiB family protein [Corynebacterium uterequi]AKK10375.1 putative unusual protein kinase [Corynebacterium uterequi]
MTADNWYLWVAAFPLGVLLTLTLAATIRKILGHPIGWARTIILSMVMVFTAPFIIDRLSIGVSSNAAGNNIAPALVVTVIVLWVFGLGATLLTLLEIVLPSGRVANALSWVFGWRSYQRRARRFRQVLKIFIKNGLARDANAVGGSDRAVARALRRSLEEAGVAYVKLGQNIASREDVVPAAFVEELSLLHSSVQPEEWASIEPLVVAELGCPIDEVFASVDPTPVAAASVAQVHRGTLVDGRQVVLKVQRPSALQEVSDDGEIIEKLCAWLEEHTVWGQHLKIGSLGRGFVASLKDELDYETELHNTQQLAEALRGSAIRCPRVYPEYSSRKLLVMDYLDGTPVGSATQQLAALTPETREDLAKKLVNSVLEVSLTHGVFHADIHPGNVMLLNNTDTPTLALLDFGVVGRLDARSRGQVAMLFMGVERGDARFLADSLIALFGRPANLDEVLLQSDIGQLLVYFRSGSSRSSAEMFSMLLRLVVDHGFRVPPEMAAMFRSMAGLEGTVAQISDAVDLVAEVRSVGSMSSLATLGRQSLKDMGEQILMDSAPVLAELPRRFGRITESLENGSFRARVSIFANPEDRRFVGGLVQQVVTALLSAAFVLAGVLLLAFEESDAEWVGYLSTTALLGYVLLVVGVLFALRVVALLAITRPGKNQSR